MIKGDLLMSNPKFQPLLFAGDINVYSVARAFHEAYGVKSIVYSKFRQAFPCSFSSIIDFRSCPDNDTPDALLRNVKQVAAECAGTDVIAIGCGDSYVKLIAMLKKYF